MKQLAEERLQAMKLQESLQKTKSALDKEESNLTEVKKVRRSLSPPPPALTPLSPFLSLSLSLSLSGSRCCACLFLLACLSILPNWPHPSLVCTRAHVRTHTLTQRW